ncbi:transcription factor LBX2 isoform X1 [Oenanthe melanoleuca]|uniref:transcription factor LBX2 isoform X1 n=1 Tax=Oenanthe melanoleuca TaxID=2939378 RepID=UPI0024C1F5B8|nr:transcription factor LBX2 isoform X1 [Oenanthe melanoleuca]
MWSEPRFGSVSAAAAGLEPTGGRSEKEIGTAIGIPPAAWSRARGGDPRLAGDLYVARGSSDGTGAGSGHGIECGVQPGLGSPEIAEKEGPGSLPRLAASFRAPGAAAGGTRMSQPRSQRGRLRHDRGHCRTMIPGFQRRPRFGLLGSVGHDSLWDGSSAFGSMWADSSPFYRESAGPGAGTHPQCSARLGGAGTGAVTGALALLCPQVRPRRAPRARALPAGSVASPGPRSRRSSCGSWSSDSGGSATSPRWTGTRWRLGWRSPPPRSSPGSRTAAPSSSGTWRSCGRTWPRYRRCPPPPCSSWRGCPSPRALPVPAPGPQSPPSSRRRRSTWRTEPSTLGSAQLCSDPVGPKLLRWDPRGSIRADSAEFGFTRVGSSPVNSFGSTGLRSAPFGCTRVRSD